MGAPCARLPDAGKWCDHVALISLRPHLYLHLSLRGVAIGLVWVALLSASMMVWLEVGRTLKHPKPIQLTATTKPTAIAWGDRVFAGRSGLAQWLKDHGLGYSAWARRHPAAAQVVDPHAMPVPKVVQKKPPRPRPPAAHAARAAPPKGTGVHVERALPKIGLIGLLILLFGFAALPPRLARLSRRLPAGVRLEQRFYAAAGAVAILTGIVVGSVIN
jgi:hypothetical protein